MADFFLNVSEQFYSIQGESTHAGLPCLFLRLAGCNLRCSYCDSSYTWKEEGKEVSTDQILEWIATFPGVMVELTGGEPLLQEGVYPLMDRLLAMGRTVLVETNGSISIDRVPYGAVVILDFKCPGSDMDSDINWDNITHLRTRQKNGSHDEVKFVLSSTGDFYWAKDIIEKYRLYENVSVLFSPNEKTFSPAELAELILQHRLPVRLQMQLHRILWPDQERGV